MHRIRDVLVASLVSFLVGLVVAAAAAGLFFTAVHFGRLYIDGMLP